MNPYNPPLNIKETQELLNTEEPILLNFSGTDPLSMLMNAKCIEEIQKQKDNTSDAVL